MEGPEGYKCVAVKMLKSKRVFLLSSMPCIENIIFKLTTGSEEVHTYIVINVSFRRDKEYRDP